MSVIAKRYADALFLLAKEQGQENTVLDELQQVLQIVEAHPRFIAILNHPHISVNEKKTLLSNVFKGALSTISHNFLQLLVDKGRQNIFAPIVQAFETLVNDARGVTTGDVVTVVELTPEEREQLETAFTAKLGTRVELKNVIDKDIKGGVLVRIGDRVYDGSVVGKLNRFTRQLQNVQV